MMFRSSLITLCLAFNAFVGAEEVRYDVVGLLDIESAHLFEEWTALYGKIYQSLNEKGERAQIWLANHSKSLLFMD